MSNITRYIKGDRVIWMIVMILLVISLLSVYSSTGSLAYAHQEGNTVFYLFRQLKFILLGLVIIFFVHLIPYQVFSRLSVVAWSLTMMVERPDVPLEVSISKPYSA